MNVKFAIKAECRVDNIDRTATEDEIARGIEDILAEEGLKSIVEVYGLTYEEEETR